MPDRVLPEADGAQKYLDRMKKKRQETEEREEKEAEIRAVARASNSLVNCDICCEDRAPNRMAVCSGSPSHSYCFKCVRTHVEGLIGAGKHLPTCMESTCRGFYTENMLRLILDRSTMERMERLQQNAQLKGVAGIEECPRCNFKCLPTNPVIFHCQNSACEAETCRKCKEWEHVPLTCAEAKKKANSGANLNIRHLLEEAMSLATVRECHLCTTKFIKEEGCNHMKCGNCGATSCYVCRQPNVDHSHFSNHPFMSGCPLFANNTEQQEAEVKRAEEEAKAIIKRDHPEVTDEDLKIAMSDNVKQDDERKRNRAAREARGELWQPGDPIHGDHGEDIGNMNVMLGPQFGPMAQFARAHRRPMQIPGGIPGNQFMAAQRAAVAQQQQAQMQAQQRGLWEQWPDNVQPGPTQLDRQQQPAPPQRPEEAATQRQQQAAPRIQQAPLVRQQQALAVQQINQDRAAPNSQPRLQSEGQRVRQVPPQHRQAQPQQQRDQPNPQQLGQANPFDGRNNPFNDAHRRTSAPHRQGQPAERARAAAIRRQDQEAERPKTGSILGSLFGRKPDTNKAQRPQEPKRRDDRDWEPERFIGRG